ncbi:MAG: hypothetical protein BMS9Abin11_0710 [Gammaproteobacteria bacterium]|nr:MAG: hypothetical protein BMS9Abin11_0710 [Gammaproteobacteria bacterium]
MAETKYDRGSALSIFKSDRAEDMVALTIALVLAFLVVAFIGS